MIAPPLPGGLRPDLERGRRFVDANPPPGRLVQCGVTGAHFYGFPSPDSDLDLKGIHLAETSQILGLGPVVETHDVLTDFEGLEHDLTTHEAAKAIGLLLRGNGNMLERILSPIQLVDGDEELASLARGCVSKRFVHHYRGFFHGMQREHGLQGTAKTMLYSYRVALTGIRLLETGEVVGDVRALGPHYGLDLSELVAFKANGLEKGALDAELDARFRAGWPQLTERLEAAFEASTLVDEPPNREAFEDWLVRRRRAAL